MGSEDTFPQLVSLACHDLRTPLATVSGFAHTLDRLDELREPAVKYVQMINAASEQLAELLNELALVARIVDGRYEPTLVVADTLVLAREAAERLGEAATAEGHGSAVRVDREAVARGLAALARCALRHGGLRHVELEADGSTVSISPVTPHASPVLLGEELRDLGAATARQVVEALGGSLTLEGERLLVRLPGA